jgi:hypothetical protein
VKMATLLLPIPTSSVTFGNLTTDAALSVM